jgi:hypothetical protein
MYLFPLLMALTSTLGTSTPYVTIEKGIFGQEILMSSPTVKYVRVDHLIVDHVHSTDWDHEVYRIIWLVNCVDGEIVCHGWVVMPPYHKDPIRDVKLNKIVYYFKDMFCRRVERYMVLADTCEHVSSNQDIEHTMKVGDPKYFEGKAK